MKYIRFFDEIKKEDKNLVGGKGLSLAIMSQNQIPVPAGFVVTSDAFREFYKKEISEEFKNEIQDAFKMLNSEIVAVRSSAISEDSQKSSWAGQLTTKLCIVGDKLIESIMSCWDSSESERVLNYAKEKNIAGSGDVAVVVQTMINPDIAGVCFTQNPISKNNNEIMIEAVYGLGEQLVQGLVTPANFVMDKLSTTLKSKTNGDQDKILKIENASIVEVKNTLAENTEILSEKDLAELVEIAKRIEKIFESPQDIEWVKTNDQFLIVQARPITT